MYWSWSRYCSTFGRIQRDRPDLDGAGGLHDLTEAGDVEGQDPVDLLAGAGSPHPRCQFRRHVELRGEAEIAPVDARLEPTPVALEVAGDRDLTGGEGQATRLCKVPEMDRAVSGGGRADLEEGSGPGPHLGVVAGQHQVGLGALEDGGGDGRHSGGRDEPARASSSWRTNWSCLLASGATRAWSGPVSMAESWRAAASDSTDSRRSDCTRCGPAPCGWSSTSWTWPRNAEPTIETCWAAELSDRADRN